jgi:prepilin-type N-terminal cleavage/methylation domain-containing protein
MNPGRQLGFTLVELAIVLVIVGLVLGMAFKGRELIDGARVKSMAATVNKAQAAINVFYERYQFFPGDGCAANGTNSVAACSQARDGLLTTAAERSSFYALLATPAAPANPMMTDADFQSPFGQRWAVVAGGAGNLAANTSYLAISDIPNTIASTAVGARDPGLGTLDVRHACALDRMIDDGDPAAGNVRSSGTYAATTPDCWALENAQVTLAVRMLP